MPPCDDEVRDPCVPAQWGQKLIPSPHVAEFLFESAEALQAFCTNGHPLGDHGLSQDIGWDCNARLKPDGCESGITGVSRCRCGTCNNDMCQRSSGVDATFQMFPLYEGSKIHMALTERNQVQFHAAAGREPPAECVAEFQLGPGPKEPGLQLTIKDLGSHNGVGIVLPGQEPQCLEKETVVLPGTEIILPWNASPDQQVRLVMKFDQNGSGTPTISAIVDPEALVEEAPEPLAAMTSPIFAALAEEAPEPIVVTSSPVYEASALHLDEGLHGLGHADEPSNTLADAVSGAEDPRVRGAPEPPSLAENPSTVPTRAPSASAPSPPAHRAEGGIETASAQHERTEAQTKETGPRPAWSEEMQSRMARMDNCDSCRAFRPGDRTSWKLQHTCDLNCSQRKYCRVLRAQAHAEAVAPSPVPKPVMLNTCASLVTPDQQQFQRKAPARAAARPPVPADAAAASSRRAPAASSSRVLDPGSRQRTKRPLDDSVPPESRPAALGHFTCQAPLEQPGKRCKQRVRSAGLLCSRHAALNEFSVSLRTIKPRPQEPAKEVHEQEAERTTKRPRVDSVSSGGAIPPLDEVSAQAEDFVTRKDFKDLAKYLVDSPETFFWCMVEAVFVKVLGEQKQLELLVKALLDEKERLFDSSDHKFLETLLQVLDCDGSADGISLEQANKCLQKLVDDVRSGSNEELVHWKGLFTWKGFQGLMKATKKKLDQKKRLVSAELRRRSRRVAKLVPRARTREQIVEAHQAVSECEEKLGYMREKLRKARRTSPVVRR